jgi:hypothetical protein
MTLTFLTTSCLLALSLISQALATEFLTSIDCRIKGWASQVDNLRRGPQDQTHLNSPKASFGDSSEALGAANANPANPVQVVSLGDGGSITLRFDAPIYDGEGTDFVVFENGFLAGFHELAFVEVSTDGSNFKRFPAVSKSSTDTQVTAFGAIDPTAVHNLAGNAPAGWGTAFDLKDLGQDTNIDVTSIHYVRIIDVVGSIDPIQGSRDSLGNLINDPFPTPFASGGFDLDAVGALYQKPTTFKAWQQETFDGCDGKERGQIADHADPDQDGMTNWEEYAQGTNPKLPNERLGLEILMDGEHSIVTARLPADLTDTHYLMETSSDLHEWSLLAEKQGPDTLETPDHPGAVRKRDADRHALYDLFLQRQSQHRYFRLRYQPSDAGE